MTVTRLCLRNTSISNFKNCKTKFKYRYIDKMPYETISSPNLPLEVTIHNTFTGFNQRLNGEQLDEIIVPIYKEH